MNPELRALEHVVSIPPYPPGRPISAVAREYGLEPHQIVKLASNENPLGASPRALEAMREAATTISLYPDFDNFALRDSLSQALGISSDRILPGAGSSDHIILIARAFLAPGTSAVVPQYSFAAYAGAIASVGARSIVSPARDFAIDCERLLAAMDASVRVVYLATPNNPTGTRLQPGALRNLLERIPEHIIVVLDEAYREYLNPADRPDTDHLPEARPNVVVLRTFSKIHGLAGLRVGYAIADPRMVQILRRLQMPFSVNSLAEAAAAAALGDVDFPAAVRVFNDGERARIANLLSARSVDYVPSHTNFILMRVGSGREIFQALLRRGVIVRPMDNYGLPEWIRVSIGLPAQNDKFLLHLSELMSSGAHLEART